MSYDVEVNIAIFDDACQQPTREIAVCHMSVVVLVADPHPRHERRCRISEQEPHVSTCGHVSMSAPSTNPCENFRYVTCPGVNCCAKNLVGCDRHRHIAGRYTLICV